MKIRSNSEWAIQLRVAQDPLDEAHLQEGALAAEDRVVLLRVLAAQVDVREPTFTLTCVLTFCYFWQTSRGCIDADF